jgi:hypothetical protein
LEKTVAIAESIGIGIGLAVGLGALALELRYRKRPLKQLELTRGKWQIEVNDPHCYRLVGELELINHSPILAIVIPELSAEVKLFSKGSLDGITTRTQVIPLHADTSPREDGYWFAYLMKEGKTTRLKIAIEISGEDLSQLESAWIKVDYIAYGSIGSHPRVQHIVLPLRYPDANVTPQWLPKERSEVLPIKTHLLCHQDEILEIIDRYVKPYTQPGDILTLGETPVAIMQGRWKHPQERKLGWVASRFCFYFLQTASISTAYGLQSLVDEVGPVRVVLAFLGGAIAKILGKPGAFYQLAGEQARLIDDITGTLPPYDQFTVLGPSRSQDVVDDIKQKTGLSAAIVDVNDLKAVKILAATSDISPDLLEAALRSNPAGNADEQTPLVLIRPTDRSLASRE